jgi:hypothetical protein
MTKRGQETVLMKLHAYPCVFHLAHFKRYVVSISPLASNVRLTLMSHSNASRVDPSETNSERKPTDQQIPSREFRR